MKTKIFTPQLIFATIIVLIAVFFRLFTQVPNFTPIGAIALFGGVYFTRKSYALLLPFAALLISDLFLGFHHLMFSVYLSFALVVGLGVLIKNNVKYYTVLGGAIGAAVLFFILTNFAVWVSTPYYTKDLVGLIQCYTLAIPFFFNGLLGDVFYSTVMFGSLYVASIRFPILAKQSI